MFFNRPTMRDRVTAEPLFTGQFSLEFDRLPYRAHLDELTQEFDFNGQKAELRFRGEEYQEGEGGNGEYTWSFSLFNIPSGYKSVKFTIYYYTKNGYYWSDNDSQEYIPPGWYPIDYYYSPPLYFTGNMGWVAASKTWQSAPKTTQARNEYWCWWRAADVAEATKYKIVFDFVA